LHLTKYSQVMKSLFALASLAVLGLKDTAQAQQTGPEWCPVSHKCTPEEKAAEACIEIYQPALGVYEDKTYQLFGNGCIACVEDGIYKYYQMSMCDPSYEVGGICTLEYSPVCGLTEDRQLKEYGNRCGACTSGEVESYFPGHCPNRLAGPHDA